jgi:hypothetical protein
MTLNVVGAATANSGLLDPAWHSRLTEEQLAAYVRYQYIWQKDNAVDWDSRAHSARRPAWDGGKDLYGVCRTSTWGEIAKRVRNFEADPGLWVHAHFSPVADRQINPATASLPEIRPSTLHSARSPQIYTKYCEFLPDMLWQQYELAGKTIETRFKTSSGIGLSQEDQSLYVLCDESYVSATPFFRHAFAASAQCYDAVEQYLWVAALDYEVHQRAYDAVVAKNPSEAWWITDDLKAAVIEIRQHWEAYNG